MQFKNIALIGKYKETELTEHILSLANYLNKINVKVYLDCGNECQKFSGFETGNIIDWLDIIDVVIVIGGDGTLLSVARNIVDHDIPVIGVNQGKLGFMTDIAIDEMLTVIEDILLNNNYILETRTLLAAEVIRNSQKIAKGIALNDIVISRGAIGNMIEFDIDIDEQFVLSQKSDGVIFSTPTGSTAYSLAAGGPILQPNVNVFSIVPICPQSLTNRPLVVNDEGIIKFTLIQENSTQIHYDGQECFDLCYQDEVILFKNPKSIKLIHPKNYNYYRTLRKKFDWSKRIS